MASPDESLFQLHLEQAPFQLGVSLGRWGLHPPEKEWAWPHVIMWVAGDKRFTADGKVHLRFTLDGYPQQAPTACPWDITENRPLAPERWPKGDVNVSRVFKPSWNPAALYAPCDRLAMVGHETWRPQFPRWWWQPDFTIVRYLEFVHDCLSYDHE